MVAAVTIGKRADLDPSGRRDSELDHVFFECSATRSFENDAAKAAFRERWLGRYLRVYPEWVYVALDANGKIVGYLLGCLDDPAKTPMFDDIGYFKALPDLMAAYPAHLHVNLTEPARGQGTGRQLVEAFAKDAVAAGSPGIHVVTGRNMQNVEYYAKVGFEDATVFPWNGKDLVVLGRKLKP
jgi:GNAT superfamily N-acetyltransferase